METFSAYREMFSHIGEESTGLVSVDIAMRKTVLEMVVGDLRVEYDGVRRVMNREAGTNRVSIENFAGQTCLSAMVKL